MTPAPPDDDDGPGQRPPDRASRSVHEYADDDYDPAHGARRGDAAPDPGAARPHDGPLRTNRTRVLLGIAGLLAALVLFNLGLDILGEPPETPTPTIPPRPSTSAAPVAPSGSTPGTAGSLPPATSLR